MIHRMLRTMPVWMAATLLSACAHWVNPPLDVSPLLADERFGSPAIPSAEPLFAVSPAMVHFLQNDLRVAARKHGAQEGLFEALSDGGHLKLDYDASVTRTAAEAFEARAGNCLSLVLMTAALARELGLQVGYQLVEVPDIWSRTDQFVMLNGHVNLTLAPGPRGAGSREMGRLTIDFQPVADPRLARVRSLDEGTVVAMYFNNRAVEWMEQGQWSRAYAALRAALRADGAYLNTLNTLAVLYRKAGEAERAERVLRTLLAAEPGNRHAASNLAMVLHTLGRVDEARQVEARLPPAPFADFERGMALVREANWPAALQAFERQLKVAPDFHGVHFQLARVHWEMGHVREARSHLLEASEYAPTGALRQRYQGKMRAIKALGSTAPNPAESRLRSSSEAAS